MSVQSCDGRHSQRSAVEMHVVNPNRVTQREWRIRLLRTGQKPPCVQALRLWEFTVLEVRRQFIFARPHENLQHLHRLAILWHTLFMPHPAARVHHGGVRRREWQPRAGYPEYHEWLASLFVPLASPAIAEEHESSLSLIAAVEAGRGVALIAQGLESMAGSRLKIRALNPAPAPVVVGVAYRKGKITAVAEKFLAALRRVRPAG